MFTELNRRDNFYTDDQPQTEKVINNVFVSTNSLIIISRTTTTIPRLQGQLVDNRQASILQMSSMPSDYIRVYAATFLKRVGEVKILSGQSGTKVKLPGNSWGITPEFPVRIHSNVRKKLLNESD